jgi:hypothetical protein
MTDNLQIGQVVRFINPDDNTMDVGELKGFEGGELKIMTREGLVYIERSALRGGKRTRKNKSKKNRKSRRNRK